MDVLGSVLFGASAVALVVALALPVLGARLRPPAVTVVMTLLTVLAVATLLYAFTAEGYTNDGRTVWAVADWPRRWLLIGATVLAVAAIGLAVRTRRRPALVPVLSGATILVAFIDYLALASTIE